VPLKFRFVDEFERQILLRIAMKCSAVLKVSKHSNCHRNSRHNSFISFEDDWEVVETTFFSYVKRGIFIKPGDVFAGLFYLLFERGLSDLYA
jgi:hypothetical protein